MRTANVPERDTGREHEGAGRSNVISFEAAQTSYWEWSQGITGKRRDLRVFSDESAVLLQQL